MYFAELCFVQWIVLSWPFFKPGVWKIGILIFILCFSVYEDDSPVVNPNNMRERKLQQQVWIYKQ